MRKKFSKDEKELFQEIRYEYTIPFFNSPRLFKQKRSFIALDLGSNVSGFSLVFHRNFSKIFSFEASAKNVDLARNYLDLLEISNTTVYNRALAKKDNSKVTLHRVLDSNGNYRNSDFTTTNWDRLESGERNSNSQIEQIVEGIALSSIFEFVGTHIDFLKCDVEGAEYDGFIGQNLDSIKFLVMELHYDALGEIKTRELLDHFEKYFDYYRPADKNLFSSWPPPQILRMVNKSDKSIKLKLGRRINQRIVIKFVRIYNLVFR